MTRKEKRADARRATRILVTVVVIAVVSAAWLWRTAADADQPLAADLCDPKGRIAAHTILMIDRTDKITQRDREYLERLLERLLGELEPGARFSMYGIDDQHGRVPSRLFSMCNPGTARTTNVAFRTPAFVQADFERRFAQPARDIVRRIALDVVANESPIIEAFRIVTLMDDFGTEVATRKLVVVSDMLQNTPEYSHYRDSLDFAAVRSSPKHAAVRADLHNVSVEVHYLGRPTVGNVQGDRHLAFWRDFFEAAGTVGRFEAAGT